MLLHGMLGDIQITRQGTGAASRLAAVHAQHRAARNARTLEAEYKSIRSLHQTAPTQNRVQRRTTKMPRHRCFARPLPVELKPRSGPLRRAPLGSNQIGVRTWL